MSDLGSEQIPRDNIQINCQDFLTAVFRKKKPVLGNFDLKTFTGHRGTAVPKPKDTLLNLRKRKKKEAPYFGISSKARIKTQT